MKLPQISLARLALLGVFVFGLAGCQQAPPATQATQPSSTERSTTTTETKEVSPTPNPNPDPTSPTTPGSVETTTKSQTTTEKKQ